MYKALVLDIDGTLYKQSIYHKAAKAATDKAKAYLESIGKPETMTKEIYEAGAVKHWVSYVVNTISQESNVDRYTLLNEAYDLEPEDFGIVEDGRLVKDLALLYERMKLYTFTNSPLIWAGRVMREVGADQVIDSENWITYEKLNNGIDIKPSKESFEIVIKKIGAKPSEMLFLDDSLGNIEEARKVGMNATLICNEDHECKKTHNGGISIYTVLENLDKGKY